MYKRQTQTTGTGFVEKWYDQSGNNKHATQTSLDRQAKIVGNGVYLNGISLDGDDHYDLDSPVTNRTNFFVGSADLESATTTTEANSLIGNHSTGSYVFIAPTSLSFAYAISVDGSVGETANLRVDGTLVSATATNSGTNGTTIVHNQEHLITWVYNSNPNNDAQVLFSFNNDYEFKGLVKEFIIYDSDQTTNVPAIEANINNQYSIYS